MKTIVKAFSYPAEAEIVEDGGLYHYIVVFEEIILADTAPTITEAAEEIVRFLVFWATQKGYTAGVIRDIAETIAVAVSLKTGENVKRGYRQLSRI